MQSGWLRDSVDAFDCDQLTVDHVGHPEPADSQPLVIAPVERSWRTRVRGQGCHSRTDLAHPVLIL
jgi:hypothetical protein